MVSRRRQLGRMVPHVADPCRHLYAQVALANVARGVSRCRAPCDDGAGRRPVATAGAHARLLRGCYDWHSSVEMHWVLVRLLRYAGDHVPQEAIRATLTARFQPDALTAEARFAGHPDDRARAALRVGMAAATDPRGRDMG